MSCQGDEAATCLHNELWFTLHRVIKLNAMAAAVWWHEVVNKSFDTNFHVRSYIVQSFNCSVREPPTCMT